MSNVTVDDSQVKALLSGLDETQLNNILFGALKKGANALKQCTLANLRSKISSKASSKTNKRSIEDGVRMKGDKAYCEVNVNIMGDSRLRWLEKGTDIRKNANGANRGKIAAREFFAEARNNETTILGIIEADIDKSLKKL